MPATKMNVTLHPTIPLDPQNLIMQPHPSGKESQDPSASTSYRLFFSFTYRLIRRWHHISRPISASSPQVTFPITGLLVPAPAESQFSGSQDVRALIQGCAPALLAMVKKRLGDHLDVCACGCVVGVPHPSADTTPEAVIGAAWKAGYVFAVLKHTCVVGLVE